VRQSEGSRLSPAMRALRATTKRGDYAVHPSTGLAAVSSELCFPDGVTHGQVKDMVKAYLTAHAEDRHHAASVLIKQALRQAFPCQ
jgi:Rap1a immunity proteins